MSKFEFLFFLLNILKASYNFSTKFIIFFITGLLE
ncbi:hypothetical protein [Plasmodium yoelii yoelii]|uniref:Uncharacterized protein n=1 Tax=Plasmodium yoelii yoelii TaxID=73239 RepID=Q7REC7_PLAYO|nr:hypothetical protein [Plasmodium yoelii yoelii]